MKKLTTVFLLLCTSFLIAQQKNITINEAVTKDSEAKVTSISYSVNSAKKLESIDWNAIKTIFKDNAQDVDIKMSFGINLKEPENSKMKVSGKFSVEGKSENIDDLIKISKKGINGLVKIYNKHENK
jgi:hypothetical protein